MIEVILPRPPSVNNYWKPDWKRRKMYLTKAAKEFRKTVKARLYEMRVQKMKGRLRCTVEIHQDPRMPPEQTVDFDNCNKALFDALQHGGAYKDDRQGRELHVTMKDTHGLSFVLVRVEEMPDLPPGGPAGIENRSNGGTSLMK